MLKKWYYDMTRLVTELDSIPTHSSHAGSKKGNFPSPNSAYLRAYYGIKHLLIIFSSILFILSSALGSSTFASSFPISRVAFAKPPNWI